MDRSYSPVSPYGRAYESHARTYASRGGNKLFSYLRARKNKQLRTGLMVTGIVLLVLCIFFTVLLKRDFTIDELNGSWKNLASTIVWTKSEQGKMFVGFLWLLFAIVAISVAIGYWPK